MDKTIALYMRLSDEDDNLAAHEESNSISHQRKLMLDHIQKLPELKDCNIMEFSDDGYSGADFSRPNFVKMMDLVKAGKIQVIVTKDYSRLGRDYLEVGNYMETLWTRTQKADRETGCSVCRKTNPIHQATAGFRSGKRKTARKSG